MPPRSAQNRNQRACSRLTQSLPSQSLSSKTPVLPSPVHKTSGNPGSSRFSTLWAHRTGRSLRRAAQTCLSCILFIVPAHEPLKQRNETATTLRKLLESNNTVRPHFPQSTARHDPPYLLYPYPPSSNKIAIPLAVHELFTVITDMVLNVCNYRIISRGNSLIFR